MVLKSIQHKDVKVKGLLKSAQNPLNLIKQSKDLKT